jgi:hypothetical protein
MQGTGFRFDVRSKTMLTAAVRGQRRSRHSARPSMPGSGWVEGRSPCPEPLYTRRPGGPDRLPTHPQNGILIACGFTLEGQDEQDRHCHFGRPQPGRDRRPRRPRREPRLRVGLGHRRAWRRPVRDLGGMCGADLADPSRHQYQQRFRPHRTYNRDGRLQGG